MTNHAKGTALVLGPEEGESFWQPLPSTGYVINKFNPYNSPYDTFSTGLQVLESGVRHSRPVEAELLQLGQSGQVRQADVRDRVGVRIQQHRALLEQHACVVVQLILKYSRKIGGHDCSPKTLSGDVEQARMQAESQVFVEPDAQVGFALRPPR